MKMTAHKNKYILFIIAALVLIIALMASFSWFTRPAAKTDTYTGAQFTGTAVIKGESCTATTYKAQLDSGNLNNLTALSTNNTITIAAGDTQYFRTTVTNSQTSATVISLTGLTLNGASGLKVYNMAPLKEYYNYADSMTFSKNIAVPASGNVNVDWYIYNDSGADKTLTVGALPQISYY